MSEIHIADFSFKVVRKSSNFFRSIWNPINERDIDTNVYRDYSTTKKYNYVNDFVCTCSNKTSNLTSEQVVCIHEDNNAKAKEFNNDLRIGYDTPDRKEVNQVLTSIASNDLSSTDTSEMTPTDELLDMLQIPQGKRHKRLEILERQSEIFFRYLCLHIGTPTIVKTRRFIHNHFMFQFYLFGQSLQLIGSKSEGLNMSGSDTDVMATDRCKVYEKNDRPCFSKGYLEYDSQMDNVPPGYVFLEFAGSDEFLPSNSFHELASSLQNEFTKDAFTRNRHGPASMSTIAGEEFDIVRSLQSESWPQIAGEWIYRKRLFGWPSGEMINAIVKKGCYVVPVGRSRDHANDKEWRLSFSIAEKELVKTFNHTQILVYGLLKTILKDLISKHKNFEKLICSYFLKTVLFWAIEESRRSYWVPKNIFLCFHLCFRRLIQFVVDVNCPNYFVASNNMFEGRFTSQNKEELIRILCELFSSGWQLIFQSKSLFRFPNFLPGSKSQLERLTSMAVENEQLECLNILSKLVGQGRMLISSAFSGQVGIRKCKLNKFLKKPILRKKIIPMFCHFMDINQCNWNNKDLYTLYLFQMKLFTIDFKDNVVSGKILLATWLYKKEKYEDCLKITDVAVKNIDLCIFHNGLKSRFFHKFKQIVKCCHDVTDLHYFCSVDIPVPFESILMLKEMSSLFKYDFIHLSHQYGLPFISLYPEMYVYFLRSLCFHRLGDTHNSEIEYRNMMSVDFICADHLKSSYQFVHIYLKLLFNIARYDIDIDMTNMSTIARSVIPHLHKLDLTEPELFIIVNLQENMFQQGLHPAAVADLSGVPGEFWTKLNDLWKYVYKR